MNKIILTGDKHGMFDEVLYRYKYDVIKSNDILIILGDAGLNYYLDKRDAKLKSKLNDTGIIFMIVRGNHEARPCGPTFHKQHIISNDYTGDFIVEDNYPNILYMIDGETYIFNDGKGGFYKTLVIGGAYSVDKYFRLAKQSQGYKDYKWFEEEQLTQNEMDAILNNVSKQSYDFVFTHTIPYDFRPVDMFLSFIDQKTVDESMEKFLQTVYDNITFKKWYVGHWHTDRIVDPFRFLYHDFITLGSDYE